MLLQRYLRLFDLFATVVGRHACLPFRPMWTRCAALAILMCHSRGAPELGCYRYGPEHVPAETGGVIAVEPVVVTCEHGTGPPQGHAWW